MRRLTVLHVAESFGGGVADAIASYAHATPEHRHHLIYALRSNAPVDSTSLTPFASAVEMRSGHLKRVRDVRRRAKALAADVIHAHSSFGGLYGRLAASRATRATVYTPHCFAFERRDVTPVTTWSYRAVEAVLASNTSVFAACSPREAHLARSLGRRVPAVHVPNVASVTNDRRTAPAPRALRESTGTAAVTVAGAGRVAPQKGTPAFARIAEAFAHDPRVRFRWIGGGDHDLEGLLRRSGVEVTGWKTKRAGLAALAEADVYLHTADWEGFPVGLLEAIAVGLPSLVLDRPYAMGLPDEMVVGREAEAVSRVQRLVDSVPLREELLRIGQGAFSGNTLGDQARELRGVYELAMERRVT